MSWTWEEKQSIHLPSREQVDTTQQGANIHAVTGKGPLSRPPVTHFRIPHQETKESLECDISYADDSIRRRSCPTGRCEHGWGRSAFDHQALALTDRTPIVIQSNDWSPQINNSRAVRRTRLLRWRDVNDGPSRRCPIVRPIHTEFARFDPWRRRLL